GASESDSFGILAPTASRASSYAQAARICLAPGENGCTIGADLVRAEASSSADAAGARSNDGDTKLVGVTVAGTPVPATPDPNTRIEIPGIGYVILNEQFCDDQASLPDCAGSEHTGLTVRAIHLVVTAPDNPLGLRVGDVIVAEAHSGATFI
ncbi:MAG TPA: choice-of-anchor P family protein, partial [Actinomycetota bacterium]|nr:choice-of-anchor P family protein [Actinomycetota bacterium]